MVKQSDQKSSQPTMASFNQSLCAFLDNSPTPFHATQSLKQMLQKANFKQLEEADDWQLEAGGRYYVIRNESSIIAWVQGHSALQDTGWRMLGAHTDSPCLRVKPKPDLYQQGSWQLGVEVYGGALLNPWFDRDLSMAGRVYFQNNNDEIVSALIDLKCPVATIPSLAIHLDREANTKKSVNAQLHMPVILTADASVETKNKDKQGFESLLLKALRDTKAEAKKILDHEMVLYDTQRAALIGVDGDFIASARLDNLLSCYVDMRALADSADQNEWSLVVCSDHEEVGSQSASGAAGSFLHQVLSRISSDTGHFARTMANSLLISTDNAHAMHPNFSDKMDANHAPKINGGPVIKVNANQRYASNSKTQAIFRALCESQDVPLQDFVMRSDMACGSTIGPIIAAQLGVETLDIGLPTFGMHSIRELAGSHDAIRLYQALSVFLAERSPTYKK